MKIKQIPENERPRERLINNGVDSLSNSELIAIILQSGSKKDSALALGSKIISLDKDGMSYLFDATTEELKIIKGIGDAKACQLIAAIEFGKRVASSHKNILGKVSSPQMVVDYFQIQLKNLNKEKFIAVFLNTKNMISSYETISVGSLSASIVHPREVFNRAIKKSAASIILIHNHPSGNPNPSKEDKVITERLCEVGRIVGISVLDHLIIASSGYFSFKEMCLID